MKRGFKFLKVDFSDKELEEVNNQLLKFNIFFTPEEFKLLKTHALDDVVSILRQTSEIKFTEDGTFTVDTIYQVSSAFADRIKKKKIKNPWPLLAILEKFFIVACYKVDESEDLSCSEKNKILNSIFGSIDKTMTIESTHLSSVFPKAHEIQKQFTQKYRAIQAPSIKKKRKPIPAKTIFLLQKEINSKCPFCENEDVDHFETHHIDENPENNSILNLLRLCPICHSKITKGDIPKEQVILVKSGLAKQKIEIYKIAVDSEESAWEPYSDTSNAFHLVRNKNKSPFPIFQFGFINHYNKTIVLKDVELRVKYIYSGMSGIPPSLPSTVIKMEVKKLIIQSDKEVHFIKDFQDIEIPAGKPVIYQIELLHKSMDDIGFHAPDTRMVLFFTFKFSNDILITLPKILMNTKDENEGITLAFLG